MEQLPILASTTKFFRPPACFVALFPVHRGDLGSKLHKRLPQEIPRWRRRQEILVAAQHTAQCRGACKIRVLTSLTAQCFSTVSAVVSLQSRYGLSVYRKVSAPVSPAGGKLEQKARFSQHYSLHSLQSPVPGLTLQVGVFLEPFLEQNGGERLWVALSHHPQLAFP